MQNGVDPIQVFHIKKTKLEIKEEFYLQTEEKDIVTVGKKETKEKLVIAGMICFKVTQIPLKFNMRVTNKKGKKVSLGNSLYIVFLR